MNSIEELPIAKPPYVLEAGHCYKINYNETPISYVMIVYNQTHKSWNMINLLTGMFMYAKDVRDKDVVIKDLTVGEATRVCSIQLTSN